MSSSAMGAVFTYLVQRFTAVVQAVDPSAVIVDGPVAPSIPPPPAPIVYVGAERTSGLGADGTRQWVELGGMKITESFTVPCYIDAAVGGTDASACRTTALTVYNAIVHEIHRDLTLGGALLEGRVAGITNVQLFQTDDEVEADDGRRCVITFTVTAENHYLP